MARRRLSCARSSPRPLPKRRGGPGAGEARETRMATARHRIRYHKGTRLAEAVEIDLVPLEESFAPSPSHPA